MNDETRNGPGSDLEFRLGERSAAIVQLWGEHITRADVDRLIQYLTIARETFDSVVKQSLTTESEPAPCSQCGGIFDAQHVRPGQHRCTCWEDK